MFNNKFTSESNSNYNNNTCKTTLLAKTNSTHTTNEVQQQQLNNHNYHYHHSHIHQQHEPQLLITSSYQNIKPNMFYDQQQFHYQQQQQYHQLDLPDHHKINNNHNRFNNNNSTYYILNSREEEQNRRFNNNFHINISSNYATSAAATATYSGYNQPVFNLSQASGTSTSNYSYFQAAYSDYIENSSSNSYALNESTSMQNSVNSNHESKQNLNTKLTKGALNPRIKKNNDEQIKKAFGIQNEQEMTVNNNNGNNKKAYKISLNTNGKDACSKASDDNSSLFRNGATIRERNRMHILNDAFDDLRKIVPKTNLSEHQRLSKIATLRLAIHYISALTTILQNSGGCKPVDPSLLPPAPKRRRRRKITTQTNPNSQNDATCNKKNTKKLIKKEPK
jgi:hypothetical protein